MSFQYSPTTGLLDTNTYPASPASETAARQQFMDLFNQARDYINNSSATKDEVTAERTYANNTFMTKASSPVKAVASYQNIDSNGFGKTVLNLGNGLTLYSNTLIVPANGIATLTFPTGTFTHSPITWAQKINPGGDYTNYTVSDYIGINNVTSTYVKYLNFDPNKQAYLMVYCLGANV